MAITTSITLASLLCFMLCSMSSFAAPIRGGYWSSENDFPASSIETSHFTHVFYAFLKPDPVTFEVVVTEVDKEKLPELAQAVAGNVKKLISLGGGDRTITPVFAKLSATQAGRAAFVKSSIDIARQYGYDGLDLDWESPLDDAEMSNLALLLKDWREAVNTEANVSGKAALILSAAVYYSAKFKYDQPRSYPAEALGMHLDLVMPMCYDYHGSWDSFTGPNAALYDPNGELSTSYGIKSWLDSGVPASKIVMGLPMYGITWTLKDPNVNQIGAPATGVGPGGGALTYSEVIEFNEKNMATVKYDSVSVSYYSYAGNVWIGYDDAQSITEKVKFAEQRGLGGYFFWRLGQDPNSVLSKAAVEAWGQ